MGDLGAPGASSDSVTGENYTGQGVFWQVMIHLTFIVSAVALALIDRWSLRHVLPGTDAHASSAHGEPGSHPSDGPLDREPRTLVGEG